MRKGQRAPKVDEFAYILMAAVIFMVILVLVTTTPTEPPPTVSPQTISFSMPFDIAQTVNLTINGSGKILTNVVLKDLGDIQGFVKFSKNNFTVVNFTTVGLTFLIPSTLGKNILSGTINVSSPGGWVPIPVEINLFTQSIVILNRTIPLGNFQVSFVNQNETLDSKVDFQVTRGYFSDYPSNLVGVIDSSKMPLATGADIRIIVEDSNRAGDLIVNFNGREIYRQNVGPGEIIIPINKADLQSSNNVQISAGFPGFMFWADTVYTIRSAELIANYNGSFPTEIPFTLTSEEANNFKQFSLSFITKSFTSPLPPMTIKINSQVIFEGCPDGTTSLDNCPTPTTTFSRTFDTDILGANLILNEGENKISFSFNQPGTLDVGPAGLIVYFTRLSQT